MKVSLTRKEIEGVLREAFEDYEKEVTSVRITPHGDYLAELVVVAREMPVQELVDADEDIRNPTEESEGGTPD